MEVFSSEETSTRSFLTRLRDRSSIVFTIGLAISIASFVENLHMGRDAIAFVVAELSKIDGWANAVQAVAAIFHGALEWWRGVLKDLLSFLPFEVPRWMHDPISLVVFGFARLLQSASTAMRVPALPRPVPHSSSPMIRHFTDPILFLFMPLLLLLILDRLFYANVHTSNTHYASAIILFATVVFIAMFLLILRFRRIRRFHGMEIRNSKPLVYRLLQYWQFWWKRLLR